MEFLSKFGALAQAIPATFWGVVVGSFFSILGVWLSNRASERRMRIQFDHEQQQKVKDRTLNAKREIFLEAVTEISAALRAVGALSNAYKTDEEILAGAEKSTGIAKLVVVAGPELGASVTKLREAIQVVFWRNYPRRVELRGMKTQSDGLSRSRENYGKQNERVLEEMRQLNVAKNTDAEVWRVLNSQFDFAAKQIEELGARSAELLKELVKGQVVLAKQVQEELAAVRPLLVAALKALREELDLPIEEAALMVMVADGDELTRTIQAAANTFVDMVDANMADSHKRLAAAMVPAND